MTEAEEETVGDFSNSGLKKIRLPPLNEKKKPHTLIYDRNQISKIDGLERCQNHVQNISLAENRLVRMSGICKLRQLRILNLPNNSIASIEGLRDLRQLTWLNLAGNSIKHIGHSLATNFKLSHLDLSDNNLGGGLEGADLRHMKSLSTVLFHGNMITSLRFAADALPKTVAILSLAENELQDLTEVSHLYHLPALEQLSVMNNPAVISAVGVSGVVHSDPRRRSTTTARSTTAPPPTPSFPFGTDFDYRSYVINWCLNLKILDGAVVTKKESLKAEWLLSQGKGRQFHPNRDQHLELIAYLRKLWPDFRSSADDQACPDSFDGDSTIVTKEDMKLMKILAHQQLHATATIGASTSLDVANNNHVDEESTRKKSTDGKGIDTRYRVETPSLLTKPNEFSSLLLERDVDVYPAVSATANVLTSYEAYDSRPCGKSSSVKPTGANGVDGWIDGSAGFTIPIENPAPSVQRARAPPPPSITRDAPAAVTSSMAKKELNRTNMKLKLMENYAEPSSGDFAATVGTTEEPDRNWASPPPRNGVPPIQQRPGVDEDVEEEGKKVVSLEETSRQQQQQLRNHCRSAPALGRDRGFEFPPSDEAVRRKSDETRRNFAASIDSSAPEAAATTAAAALSKYDLYDARPIGGSKRADVFSSGSQPTPASPPPSVDESPAPTFSSGPPTSATATPAEAVPTTPVSSKYEAYDSRPVGPSAKREPSPSGAPPTTRRGGSKQSLSNGGFSYMDEGVAGRESDARGTSVAAARGRSMTAAADDRFVASDNNVRSERRQRERSETTALTTAGDSVSKYDAYNSRPIKPLSKDVVELLYQPVESDVNDLKAGETIGTLELHGCCDEKMHREGEGSAKNDGESRYASPAPISDESPTLASSEIDNDSGNIHDRPAAALSSATPYSPSPNVRPALENPRLEKLKVLSKEKRKSEEKDIDDSLEMSNSAVELFGELSFKHPEMCEDFLDVGAGEFIATEDELDDDDDNDEEEDDDDDDDDREEKRTGFTTVEDSRFVASALTIQRAWRRKVNRPLMKTFTRPDFGDIVRRRQEETQSFIFDQLERCQDHLMTEKTARMAHLTLLSFVAADAEANKGRILELEKGKGAEEEVEKINGAPKEDTLSSAKAAELTEQIHILTGTCLELKNQVTMLQQALSSLSYFNAGASTVDTQPHFSSKERK